MNTMLARNCETLIHSRGWRYGDSALASLFGDDSIIPFSLKTFQELMQQRVRSMIHGFIKCPPEKVSIRWRVTGTLKLDDHNIRILPPNLDKPPPERKLEGGLFFVPVFVPDDEVKDSRRELRGIKKP